MALDWIRIISVSIVGAILTFLIQPWFYQSDIIALTDVDILDWIADAYMPGAAIVFGTAIAASLLWYTIASRSKATRSEEVSAMRIWWALLLLIPILGICAALYFFNNSNDAVLSLALFFVLDVLIVFWFATVISSPGLLRFVPPGSLTVRHMMGLK